MESIPFQAIVSEVDHPYLYRFLSREYVNPERVRGMAKKFVCDSAENALKRQEKQDEETQEHRELMQQLEEIKTLLASGKIFLNVEQPAEAPKHSQKASDRLRMLGL